MEWHRSSGLLFQALPIRVKIFNISILARFTQVNPKLVFAIQAILEASWTLKNFNCGLASPVMPRRESAKADRQFQGCSLLPRRFPDAVAKLKKR